MTELFFDTIREKMDRSSSHGRERIVLMFTLLLTMLNDELKKHPDGQEPVAVINMRNSLEGILATERTSESALPPVNAFIKSFNDEHLPKELKVTVLNYLSTFVPV